MFISGKLYRTKRELTYMLDPIMDPLDQYPGIRLKENSIIFFTGERRRVWKDRHLHSFQFLFEDKRISFLFNDLYSLPNYFESVAGNA